MPLNRPSEEIGQSEGPLALNAKSVGTAMGCLFAFLTPFLLIGLFMLYQGWTALTDDSGEDPALFFFIGAMFTGVPLVILITSLFNGKSMIASIPLRHKFPNQPWMWRTDWARGMVRDSSRGRLAGSWATAIIATGVFVFFGLRLQEVFESFVAEYPIVTWAIVVLALALPAALLLQAIYVTLQYRKFGSSTLILSRTPCMLGGSLSGRIETTLSEIPTEGAALKLECIKATKVGSGKNQSTKLETVWEATNTLEQFRLGQGPTGVYIPVEFAIPVSTSPTGKVNSRLDYKWKLTVSMSLPGVDYHSEFEPPIFRVNADGRVSDDAPDPT